MKRYLFITFLFTTLIGKSQITLTVREIFDFKVNDEFQLKDMDYVPPNAIRTKIIGKYYSSANDTVFYIRYNDNYYTVANYYPTPHLDYYCSTYTDTVSYTNLDSTLVSQDAGFLNDTILGTTICGVPSIGWHSNDSLAYPYLAQTYGKGLGIILDVEYYSGSQYAVKNNGIFYFKKDTVSCGTPDTTTCPDTTQSIKTNNLSLTFAKVFPNPFTDKFNISLPNDQQDYILKIYDIRGIEIIEEHIDHTKNVVINSINEKGVYIIKLESASKTYVTRIIKI